MADISGYALQWGQPAIIAGAFEERFARGAFDASLRGYPDVVALWAHATDKPLGRVSNGTLQLRTDSVGLFYSLTPNPDSPMGQEALAMVGSSTVDEVSVGFGSLVEEWSDTYDMPRRLITEARLYEISFVVWGAYGKTTSASLRLDNAAAARQRVATKADAAMRLRGLG